MMMPHSSKGFSLLEILVAFVILSLTLGVIMKIFSGGLRNVGYADDYSRAVYLAESRLAVLGVEQPLQEGAMSGELDQRFRWQLFIQPYHEMEATDHGQPNMKLYLVSMKVSWKEGELARGIEFTTLRLASKK